jgi:hypothetical protein
VEVETNNTLDFLDVVVTGRSTDLFAEVYRKPTHTGHYYSSNPTTTTTMLKAVVVYPLVTRSKIIC